MTRPDTQRASPGRPRSTAAQAHGSILKAVHDLLHHTSVRELTIEAVAAQAEVGKPTLYKWWGSKNALVFAMLQEHVVPKLDTPDQMPLEQSIRLKVSHLIDEFNGFFGRVLCELIAEGQSDPGLLQELNDLYIRARRQRTVASIQRAQQAGDFPTGIDPSLVVDAIFAPIYFHKLTRTQPLDQAYGQALVDQVFGALSAPRGSNAI